MSAAQEDAAHRIAEVIELAAARGDKGMHHLMGTLARTREGACLPTLANLLLVLQHDTQLKGMLAFNEFAGQALLTRAPPAAEDGGAALPGPYPRTWGGEDVSMVQAYVQRIWAPRFGTQTVEQGMAAAAALHRFHPVRDWLATLGWDGTPRLDMWVHRAFGTPLDGYHGAVGSKFLIAAVRRIRQPGCKFDTMPVLEGPQGIGKSTAIKILFGEDRFSDAMPTNLADKDAAMALLGVWVLEFAEIEGLIRNEPETIKAFLSRAVDRYRPPYGKAYVDRPRQGVLIGTTNSQDYLRDATGNRRIWPIHCRHMDNDWVAANRLQLWAEAAHREAQGEAVWLDDADLEATAADHQRERMEEDVWTEPVREHLLGKDECSIPDILEHGLSILKERQSKREQMRVSKILTAAGWSRSLARKDGHVVRIWSRKEG